MPNVVRFALSTAKTLYVPGAGTFIDGILDVDANNLALLTKTRYLVQPYRAVEVGVVDAATPKPSLPAVPGPPSPDPYPQYLTAAEAASSPELRAVFEGRNNSKGSLTIVLGDSIDAAADLGGYYSGGSIFSNLCVLSNQRVKWLRNSGVAGNTTAQMLARIQADVIDHDPGVCIFGGATNDTGTGVPPETTKANIKAIATALRASGIKPVVRTTPPTDQAGAAGSVANLRAIVQRHNAWLRGWADSEGIPVLDYYAPLVDEATGGYLAGLSDDGVHPTQSANLLVAQYLVAQGLPAVFSGRVVLTTAVGDAGDLLAGVGLFLGTPSGGVAAGWSHYGNDATLSVETDAAIPGNWQKVTGGTSSLHVIESSDITAGFTVGDVLEFAARVQKSDAGDGGIRLRLGDAGGYAYEISPVNGLRPGLSGIAAGRLAVPSGVDRVRVECAVQSGSTMRVAQVTVTNLTALGA